MAEVRPRRRELVVDRILERPETPPTRFEPAVRELAADARRSEARAGGCGVEEKRHERLSEFTARTVDEDDAPGPAVAGDHRLVAQARIALELLTALARHVLGQVAHHHHPAPFDVEAGVLVDRRELGPGRCHQPVAREDDGRRLDLAAPREGEGAPVDVDLKGGRRGGNGGGHGRHGCRGGVDGVLERFGEQGVVGSEGDAGAVFEVVPVAPGIAGGFEAERSHLGHDVVGGERFTRGSGAPAFGAGIRERRGVGLEIGSGDRGRSRGQGERACRRCGRRCGRKPEGRACTGVVPIGAKELALFAGCAIAGPDKGVPGWREGGESVEAFAGRHANGLGPALCVDEVELEIVASGAVRCEDHVVARRVEAGGPCYRAQVGERAFVAAIDPHREDLGALAVLARVPPYDATSVGGEGGPAVVAGRRRPLRKLAPRDVEEVEVHEIGGILDQSLAIVRRKGVLIGVAIRGEYDEAAVR